MKNMVKALRYRYVKCEANPIDTVPSWKGKAALVNKHMTHATAEIHAIRDAAKDNPEMSLAVELLYEMAARV